MAEYKFLKDNIDKSSLLQFESSFETDEILLKNNADQIKKIYNFYEQENNLLFVNGFLGTGKFEIINYTTSFLNEDAVILKYNCFNATILDDILLAFFKDLKNLVLQKKIVPPKIKTENFAEKINSYFAHVDKPFLVILNSFESILDENRQEICDFIMHLTSIKKVKVIVIGRSYDSKAFPDRKVDRVTMYALDKDYVDKYFKDNSIKISSTELNELYKLSRGYYFYIVLTVNLIKFNEITTGDFFRELKNSYLTFDKFLLKQTLTLVPTIKINLFWFLILIRHEISLELLKIFDFYNEEAFEQLVSNSIVSIDKENIYISDFFDDIIEHAPVSLIHKMRFFIIKLYESQLPLKPLERHICISRQTMRKEIEYHKRFLPKMYKPNMVEMQQISSQVDLEEDKKVPEQNIVVENISPQEKNVPPVIIPVSITPDPETKDETGKVDITNVLLQLDKKSVPEENLTDISFGDLLAKLNDAHKNYKYDVVIECAQKALKMKSEPEYEKYIPMLYERMAFAYKKLAKYDKSLEYYKYIEEIYKTSGIQEKLSIIKFNEADIYYETFKIEKAKTIFLEIIKDTSASKNIIMAAYLKLAGIEEDSGESTKNAAVYLKEAVKIVKDVTNKKVLAELYFRLALLVDEKGDIEKAKVFYEKCMEIDDGKLNTFLSSAYSNYASICLDEKNEEKASEFFEKAYKTDLENANAEGVYDSASKIAMLFKRKDYNKALTYFKIALEASKHNNDKFYTVSAYLDLGDFYFENKDDEKALGNYIQALNLARTYLTKDNINKINIRINDVKFRLGEEKYNKLLNMVLQKGLQENG